MLRAAEAQSVRQCMHSVQELSGPSKARSDPYAAPAMRLDARASVPVASLIHLTSSVLLKLVTSLAASLLVRSVKGAVPLRERTEPIQVQNQTVSTAKRAGV